MRPIANFYKLSWLLFFIVLKVNAQSGTIPPITPPAVSKYSITTMPYTPKVDCPCLEQGGNTQTDANQWVAASFYETTSNDVILRETKPTGFALDHFLCSAQISVVDLATSSIVASQTFANVGSPTPCGGYKHLDVTLPASALPTTVGAYKDFIVRHKNDIASINCDGGVCTPPTCALAGEIIIGIFRVELLTPPPPPPVGSPTLQSCQGMQFVMPYTDLGPCYNNIPQWRFKNTITWNTFVYILGTGNTFVPDGPFSADPDVLIETRVLHNPLCLNLVPQATDMTNMMLYSPARGLIKILNAGTGFFCPVKNPAVLGDSSITNMLGSRQWQYSWDSVTFTPASSGGSSDSLVSFQSGYYRLKMTTQSGGCLGYSNTIKIEYPTITADFIDYLPTCGNIPRLIVKDNSNNSEAINFHVSINNGTWQKSAIGDSLTYTALGSGTVNIRYKIELNAGCESLIKQKNIDVHPAMINNFTVPPLCVGQLAYFEDLTTVTLPVGAYVVQRILYMDTTEIYSGASKYCPFIPPSATTYAITMKIVTNQNCEISTTKSVIVNPLLIVDFISPIDSLVCQDVLRDMGNITFVDSTSPEGQAATYQWDLSPNSGLAIVGASDRKTLTIDGSLGEVGKHTIMLTVWSLQGCKSMKMFKFTVLPNPVANFLMLLPLCTTEPTLWVLDNSGTGTSFMYVSIDDQAYQKLDATDTFKITLLTAKMVKLNYYIENSNNCSSVIKTKDIFIQSAVIPSMIVSANLCVGEDVTIQNTGTLNYPPGEWITQTELRINDISVLAGDSKQVKHMFLTNGDYVVEIISTTNTGCSASVKQIVHINNPLNVRFSTPFSKMVCLDWLVNSGVGLFVDETAPENNIAAIRWYLSSPDGGAIINGADALFCEVDFSQAKVGKYTMTCEIVSLQNCTSAKVFEFEVLPAVVVVVETSIELDDCLVTASLKAERKQDEAGWQEYSVKLDGSEILKTQADSFILPIALTTQPQQVVLIYRAAITNTTCVSEPFIFESILPALATPILANEIQITFPITPNDVPDMHVNLPLLPEGYMLWVNTGDSTDAKIFTQSFDHVFPAYTDILGKPYLVEMQLQTNKPTPCNLGALMTFWVEPKPPGKRTTYDQLIKLATKANPNGDRINDFLRMHICEPFAAWIEYITFEVVDPATGQILFRGKDFTSEWGYGGAPAGSYDIIIKAKLRGLAERTLPKRSIQVKR